ncbi:hypothetical protein [Nonomuraea aridisoli]|uniref:Uncharacterized protein n=1 Tax=Nonomuraea aridisoli TaxID=2070368 RepID=A0A2W2F0J5_9ACTN|nr:hypothetical protein [Nonomuraea aridisoli]PZG19390.1 hypothetical protein C1J01_12380 [Nonomuraea aridisoli]
MITMFGCGALLAGGGASAAEKPGEDASTRAGAAAPVTSGEISSLLMRAVGADLGTVMKTLPSVFCGNRLVAYNSPSHNSPTKCVNGPENSGNSTNSGNYHNEGNAINSGNFSNTNGSTGSSNNSNGGNTANGPQQVSPGG